MAGSTKACSHLGVGTERANLDTAGRDGAVRVNLFIIGVSYVVRVSLHVEEGQSDDGVA